jgi:hypothetical protein
LYLDARICLLLGAAAGAGDAVGAAALSKRPLGLLLLLLFELLLMRLSLLALVSWEADVLLASSKLSASKSPTDFHTTLPAA